MSEWEILPMLREHYSAVAAIHQEGIDTGNATFQEKTLTLGEWNQKYLTIGRLVVILNGQVVGWAALLPFSSMNAYRGVAELSIYIAKSARGKGIGKALMQAIIQTSEENGFWTLQSLIFPENKASIALHHTFGFRTLCIHEKLGEMNGTFRDVALLERRSNRNGE
ncbi:GNAT family N-acetyltransferase [Listeria ivanovii]|uniref:N-acetyltransferase n=2 Tax=Listeria ivanovii TaxID=1638 RepID=A0ABS1G4L8_LISIV|nr:GNAT family N-acetyltransferase [Listeria ivanovii]EFR96982.1 gnat family acetyltransferase [Listeria ivanovii FSL F6-596]AIS59791.1 phosphinothricin acetyltransferase [Listeria ivanovii subsp. londoniensis]AIS62625.1 phosphinothricin acetyltransferase [Listeria ivanovii subsp. londoniensis]MBC2254194.1 N-acetyltransferase [Listeria ivanovii]MBK1961808.1 N-acetyltransferase [Listeria ivanovii subsp. londoniensis]